MNREEALYPMLEVEEAIERFLIHLHSRKRPCRS